MGSRSMGGTGAVQRELQNRVEARLVTPRRDARRMYYQENRTSPLFRTCRK